MGGAKPSRGAKLRKYGIYEILPNTGDAKDFKKANEALMTYFVPKKYLSRNF